MNNEDAIHLATSEAPSLIIYGCIMNLCGGDDESRCYFYLIMAGIMALQEFHSSANARFYKNQSCKNHSSLARMFCIQVQIVLFKK